jgi:F-type H+-transporting ATPase subunit b
VLVDWFTVIAQIVNFLVLVVLLKFLLYDRIVRVMDERQQKIASRLEEAKKKKAEAEKEAESYRQKNRELDEKRADMHKQAKSDADQHRDELMQEAREEVQQQKAQWHQAIEQEKAGLVEQLRQQTARQVCEISRRALADLADVQMQEQVLDVFLRRVQELEKEERERLTDMLERSDEEVAVHTSFEVDDQRQRAIAKAVQKLIGKDREVEFKRDRGLVCGIELRCGGRALGWSVAGYLDSLERSFAEVLGDHSESELPSKSSSEQPPTEPEKDKEEQAQPEENTEDAQ